jgi:hypothetical protein
MNQQKQFTPLSVIDGKSLLALECEPPKFVVERLLPTGLSVLAGSPKVGKSWLSLWLCQQVSHGEPVWEFETCKSTVLYLALEDTVDRLHFRLRSSRRTALRTASSPQRRTAFQTACLNSWNSSSAVTPTPDLLSSTRFSG